MEPRHQPVLLAQVIAVLEPQSGDDYLDATAGYGGHAAPIIDKIGAEGRAVLVDQDREAIQRLHKRFGARVEIIRANYLEAAEQLVDDGSLFELILVDLGVSSPQLEVPERGFSFSRRGPLDMRMDQSQALTADEVVNQYPESRLAAIIRQYGEEPRARRIAAAIVRQRPITDTEHLARVIKNAVGGRETKTHPGTRTFQAIRIEVNGELSALESALPLFERLLAPGGRLAIISFHSLEDRLVKQYFDRQSKDCVCPPKQPVCTCDHRASLERLTKGALKGEELDANNPRARSARLRAARKLNQNKQEG